MAASKRRFAFKFKSSSVSESEQTSRTDCSGTATGRGGSQPSSRRSSVQTPSSDQRHSSHPSRRSSVQTPSADQQHWKTIVASSGAVFEKKWAHPKPSTASLDDFKLVRTIGVGTFARVILAQHRKDLHYYAIKVLNKDKIVKKDQVKQVLREKKVLQASCFPFIASMTYSFKDNTNLYMALEFINGGELFSYMRRSGKLTEETSRFYIAQLVLVLEYLHNVDIIYRDLKPENLLLDSIGYLKLVDFGFAKRTRSRTYTVCGTPEYLAPEIIRTKGYSFSVDWWALGVMLFEMTVGHAPFQAEQESKLYEYIIRGKFACPDHMSCDVRHLVEGLIQTDLTQRLGCLRAGVNDVKYHRWFTGTDWLAIYHKKVPAPFKPDSGTGPSDSGNFARFSDEDIVVGSHNEHEQLFNDF